MKRFNALVFGSVSCPCPHHHDPRVTLEESLIDALHIHIHLNVPDMLTTEDWKLSLDG